MKKPKALADYDLTTRIGRFRARAKGFDVPKRENTGFGKAYWSKDANHDAIVNGLEAHSIRALSMPQPGDILCYGFHRQTGVWMFLPMEIKTATGRLTPAQKARTDVPIPIVRNLADALALYGIFESAAK